MSYYRTTTHRARKLHECSRYCSGDGMIRPGQLYNEHVVAPGEYDFGSFSRWVRHRECWHCAKARCHPLPGRPCGCEAEPAVFGHNRCQRAMVTRSTLSGHPGVGGFMTVTYDLDLAA